MQNRGADRMINAIIIVGGIALVAVVLNRQRHRVRPHSVAEVERPAIEMSHELGSFVLLLNTAENEDDPHYRAALDRLRGNSAEIIAEATKLLAAAAGDPADNFALRHSVVLAIAALRDPGALDLLAEVALNPQPLPPVEMPELRGVFETRPEHRLDIETLVQATIVALDAVDGIEALASDDHAGALETLVRAAGSPSNAIRAAALTALGSRTDWHDHRRRAVDALSADLRHLAHFERKAVADVPQIRDPRVTLRGAGDATVRPPGLDDGSDLQRTTVAGAPRARRS